MGVSVTGYENTTVENGCESDLNAAPTENVQENDSVDNPYENSSYKIIRFLKKEPMTLITFFTSVITIITVVLSFVANALQRQNLLYWNVLVDVFEYNTTNLIYQLGIAIGVSITGIICITVINITFAKYFNDQMPTLQKKCADKECNHHLKKIRKKKSIVSIRLNFLEKTNFFEKQNFHRKLFEKNKKELNELVESLNSLKMKICKAKMVGVSTQRFPKIKVVFIISLLAVFMFVFLLFFTMYIVDDGYVIEKAFLLTVVVISFYSVLVYCFARKKVPKKEIKNMVTKYLLDNGQWMNIEYESEYNKKHIKEFFTDEILIRTSCMLVFFIVFIIFVIGVSFYQKPEEQKSFHTVEYQECTYVVLHTFDNKFVLEKAEESTNPETKEKQIVIDTSNHSIISIDGLTVERHEYDIVKRKQ